MDYVWFVDTIILYVFTVDEVVFVDCSSELNPLGLYLCSSVCVYVSYYNTLLSLAV